MTDRPDDLIGLAEACRLLPSRTPGRRVHLKTLYRWVRTQKLSGWKIGEYWFVSRAEVLGLARAGGTVVPLPAASSLAVLRAAGLLK
jgi:hypothetical protein